MVLYDIYDCNDGETLMMWEITSKKRFTTKELQELIQEYKTTEDYDDEGLKKYLQERGFKIVALRIGGQLAF